MFRWVWDFLNAEKTPRWQIILFGAVVFFAGVAQNEYNYWRSANDVAVQEERKRVEARLLEIQRHSVEFQTYAGAFVSSILDDKSDVNSRRAALVENILAQDAAVDISSNVFAASASQAVTEYRAALRQMKDAVDNVNDVVSMGQFWEAASNLLVARNQLLKALEEQAANSGV